MFDTLVAARAHPADGAAELLDCLGQAILTVAPDGRVSFANRSAAALFAAVPPVGLALRSLFRLAGVANGEALADAADDAASSSVRLRLPDDRILDGMCHPLPEGGTIITLHDITLYMDDAAHTANDALTGLPNRNELSRRLTDLLEAGRRAPKAFALVFVSLDRFKPVNDTLGRAVGDALLCKVAERLRNAVRKTDFVVRLGGDEFAILQTDAPQPEAAEALAGRLVDLISRTYVVSDHLIDVGASAGVAIAPADGDDAEKLLQCADLALDRAKADGRGMFRFFQVGMDAAMQTRRRLERDLRSALPLGQFSLAFQPQMRLTPFELVGFEALLRWRHPTRGAVSPGDFIPLAEELGLITPIGNWVLQSACREAASWTRPLSIAVNISPLQFRGNRLLQMVGTALAETGLDPARLELEITEGALLKDTDMVLAQLHALKTMGVRISMDDFGTGYSSLAYFLKFPFEKIKIDQSFVRGSDNSADCATIVRTVCALGASLGMATIAEGVETQQQLDRIREAGCNEVQGYFTGRPMDASSARQLLTAVTHIPGDAQ